MIPLFILNWIVGRSGGRLAERGAKAVAWIIAAVVLIVLAAFLLARRDSRMIDRHDTAQTIEVLETTGAADGNAAVTRRVDDTVLSNETAEIERTIANAPPSIAPMSDARRNYLRCVREQQARRGDPASKPTGSCL